MFCSFRYGHHSLAAGILKRLSEEAPSEAAQRWLTALHRAAAADAKLMEDGKFSFLKGLNFNLLLYVNSLDEHNTCKAETSDET